MRRMTKLFSALIIGLSVVTSHFADAAVGRTEGSFSVSPTGAATYTIPVWLPPGPKGVQPSLTLNYNSQIGDGVVGPGWYLGGLSSISRCNKTFAQDTVPAPVTLVTSDGYCLDGNRLRLTSGTYGQGVSKYQTEIANFSNIIGVTQNTTDQGPSYFEVQAKDGRTYVYGGTADSAIRYGSTVGQWLLSKVIDRFGNKYVVTYGTGAAGSTAVGVPLSISYSLSSPGASTYNYIVDFTYGPKVNTVPATNDPAIVGYVNGVQVVNTNLLLSVSVSNISSGTRVLIRKYTLGYGAAPTSTRARLTSVTECAGSAGTDCYPSTSIGYQDGAPGVSTNATVAVSGGTAISVVGTGDFDGDGRDDIVFLDGTTLKVALSIGTGYGSPITVLTGFAGSSALIGIGDILNLGRQDLLVPVSGIFNRFTWNGSAFTQSSTGIAVATNATKAALLDSDGDGRPDLVTATRTLTTQSNGRILTFNILTQLNQSTGGVLSFASAVTSGPWTWNCLSTDIFCSSFSTVYMGREGGSSVRFFDFDGDGRQDIALLERNTGGSRVVPLLATGTTYTLGVGINDSSSEDRVAVFGNWNSDGCTDIVVGTKVFVSPCNGAPFSISTLPTPVTAALDWNGDGTIDALVANGSTVDVYPSTSSGFANALTSSVPAVAATTNGQSLSFITDQKGDGQPDLLTWTASTISVYKHNSPGTLPDLATSFTDGFGNTSSPTYAPMSSATCYFRDSSPPVYPTSDYRKPIQVACSYSASDLASGTYNMYLKYYNSSADLQGRGWLGFERVYKQDSRNNLVHVEGYSNQFPNTGLLSFVQDEQGDWTTPIRTVTNTFASLTSETLDGTANNQRYFPYIASSTISEYEAGGAKNGQLISTTSKNFSYDIYGNATSISEVRTDNDALTPTSPGAGQSWTTTITSSFMPDTANWCVGIPTQVTVTQSTTVPGENTVSNTTNYTPDYAKCRITQQVAAPGSATYQVITDIGYDDATGGFGNVKSISISGAGMSSRTTNITWNSTGQYAQYVTNPLGQIVQVGYDLNKFVKTSQIDANNLTTSWDYDNFGRKIRESRADGTYTDYNYNLCSSTPGVCASPTDLKYWIQQIDRDTVGNALHETRSMFNVLDALRFVLDQNIDGSFVYKVHRGYDALGRLVLDYVPSPSESAPYHVYTVDLLGRVTQDTLKNADGSVFSSSTTTYTGRTVTFTDAQSKATTRITDVNGLMRKTQDANNYAQSFNYDAAGNLIKVIDSLSNQLFSASYDYGLKAFQRSTTDMDLGTWGYVYNALGEVTSYTDAKNQTFNMTYDGLSRPLTRTEAEGITTWVWGNSAASHNIGVLQSVSSPGYVETYSYDGLGRLSNKQISSDATYDYDVGYNTTTGQLDTLTYPTSTSNYRLKLQYGYQYGLMKQVKDYTTNTVLWQANNINAFGQVTQEAYGNGTLTNKVFDPTTSWLKSQQCGMGGGSCSQNESYLYDLVGNLTQRQNNNLGLTENFYYDNVYRLDHSTLNGTTNLQMGYDVMGNITSRSDLASGAAWTYNATHKHQVMQAGDVAHAYTYDSNGNALTRNGQSITWSSYNYPTQINASGETVNLYYDANRQRWKQDYIAGGQTETTIYAGGLMQKVTANGTTDYRYQIYAGSQLIAVMSRNISGANSLRYILEDHQGSISKITNSDGSNYISESFTAFGARRNPLTWSGSLTNGDLNKINAISREGYTGQTALGNMGLNHMNGRVQDAITGRFLNADPYITEPDNTQNYNRYSYVYNNPMTFVDPTGYSCTELQETDASGNYVRTRMWCTNPGSSPGVPNPGGSPSMNNPGNGGGPGSPGGADEKELEEVVVTGTRAKNWYTVFFTLTDSLRTVLCAVPAASFSEQVQVDLSFMGIGGEASLSASITSHGQFGFQAVAGPMFGPPSSIGAAVTGGGQGGVVFNDAPKGWSDTSSISITAVEGAPYSSTVAGFNVQANSDGASASASNIKLGPDAGIGRGQIIHAGRVGGKQYSTAGICPK